MPRARRRHVVPLGGAFAGTIRHGGAHRCLHIPRVVSVRGQHDDGGLGHATRFRQSTRSARMPPSRVAATEGSPWREPWGSGATPRRLTSVGVTQAANDADHGRRQSMTHGRAQKCRPYGAHPYGAHATSRLTPRATIFHRYAAARPTSSLLFDPRTVLKCICG